VLRVSTVLNMAKKTLALLGEQIYKCPSCGYGLTVESQVVRERGDYYVVERVLRCRKCGVRIRQLVYLNKINLQ